jgi:hypothetical protein
MPDLSLTRTRLQAGVWEGLLTAPDGSSPRLAVTHLGAGVDGVDIAPLSAGQWSVRFPLPAAAIADGVQTILISDADTGDPLDTLTLIAGDALGHDIRAELSLLRAELEMLKHAFRRYAADHP